MDNFTIDLQRGKRGEQLIKDALAARGHIITDMSGNKEYQRKDIDFIVSRNGEYTTLEVKTDSASERTGNLFIEYQNDNNKSHSCMGWLFYCAADYICFAQEHNKKAFIVSLAELRDNIQANNYRKAYSSNAAGYLLPVAALANMQSYQFIEL